MSGPLDPALLEALRRLTGHQEPSYGYGFRYDSADPKGLGFLGPLQRPDGSGVMGEYSVGQMINGQQTEFPSIVPTLTKDELLAILNAQQGQPLPESVMRKARAFAEQRMAQGLKPFAQTGEQQNVYPELPRTATPQATPTIQPMASHGQAPQQPLLDMLRQLMASHGAAR